MCSLNFFIVLLLMNLVFVINCQQSKRFFRKDYTYLLVVDNFYKIHTIHRTWAQAKARCAMEGAKLFYPQDANESEGVLSFLTETQPFKEVVIGISDTLSTGVYETIDGQPVDDVYNHWAPGSPNGLEGQDGCVVLSRDGTLRDDLCTKKYPFICKKALADLEWNTECDMPNQDYVFDKKLGKCYKFHLNPQNWTDAFGICSAEQSYLAIIESQMEADHLVKMTADAPKDKVHGNYLAGAVHLGFHNRYHEGWRSIKGVTLADTGYSMWGGGQPDNKGDGETCGSMFYNGGLNDIWCGTRCFFICEHDVGSLAGSIDHRFNDLL